MKITKKAVLSNRIYIGADEAFQKELKAATTYTIPPRNPEEPKVVIKHMKKVNASIVTIPIGRMDLIPEDYEIVDKRITIPAEFPEFKFQLRESQQKVYDEITGNAIINALPSWGKTFSALAIAAKLGQKTLVVVHTVALRDQWAREVRKVFGFAPGIIGSGRFEIDTPIVIGNTQSLYKKIPEISKAFGTLILDEMHHCSSPTFAKIVDANHARYKVGLSGTVERKDGRHVVFPEYFGFEIHKPPKENCLTPVVDIIKTSIKLPMGKSWASRINALTNDEEYLALIVNLAITYKSVGHKILIVSDRVHFLEACARLLKEDAVCVTGKVPLEQRQALIDRVESGEASVLCGTQSIFSEGISVNSLSCLILSTPINNEPLLTQLIGRIIREKPGKLQPRIVDINLKGATVPAQAKARLGLYLREGYLIETTQIN